MYTKGNLAGSIVELYTWEEACAVFAFGQMTSVSTLYYASESDNNQDHLPIDGSCANVIE